MKDITCPYCEFTEEPCHFPDFYPAEVYEDKKYNDQAVILDKMQRWGFNVVTCGECGFVILHETEV